MDRDVTTIRVRKKTKKLLRMFEVHPRETDEDIIKRLMEKSKDW